MCIKPFRIPRTPFFLARDKKISDSALCLTSDDPPGKKKQVKNQEMTRESLRRMGERHESSITYCTVESVLRYETINWYLDLENSVPKPLIFLKEVNLHFLGQ